MVRSLRTFLALPFWAAAFLLHLTIIPLAWLAVAIGGDGGGDES